MSQPAPKTIVIPAEPASPTAAGATPGQPVPPRSGPSGRRRHGHATLAMAGLLGGLVAALWAQQRVAGGATGEGALVAFAVAIGLFVAGLVLAEHAGLPVGLTAHAVPRGALAGQVPIRPPARAATAQPRTSGRLALASFGLAVVTFLASGGNQFTLFNVTTWVASVGLGLAAFWQPPVRLPRAREVRARLAALRLPPAVGLRLPWWGLALAAIIVCGGFLLFYRIGDVPREMTSDHAEKLLDVQDVLDGQHRIFFPRNTGREAFQFYWIAIMTPLTGVSYLTMKLGTALLAVFTIPFTFLLARTLFGTSFALLATAILAMSRWHLQVARVGLRFPFPPLFGAAIFYFLLKAIRDRRRNDFLLCGLALGLAQHTYTALRLAPLAVLACVGVALAIDVWRRAPPARVHRLVVDTALLFVIAGLVFVPLGRYAVEHPELFFFRGVSRIASDALSGPPPNLLLVFLDNVKNALLMFNWTGDVVWVNNIAGERLLEPVSGALFALGCAYAIYRLARFREPAYLYLFILLFVGLLPSILSLAYPRENPSTVRSGMAIPIVAILVALPLAVLLQQLTRWIGGRVGRLAGGAFLVALLAVSFRNNFVQYFEIYPRQHGAASQHTTYVAQAINGFLALGGRREDVHILPGAHWFDTRLVAIQTGDIRWNPLIASVDDARKDDGVPRERLYIVHPDDRQALEKLARWYPDAIRQSFTVPEIGNRPWFVAVRVPPSTRAKEG
jgi:hypothetical protein